MVTQPEGQDTKIHLRLQVRKKWPPLKTDINTSVSSMSIQVLPLRFFMTMASPSVLRDLNRHAPSTKGGNRGHSDLCHCQVCILPDRRPTKKCIGQFIMSWEPAFCQISTQIIFILHWQGTNGRSLLFDVKTGMGEGTLIRP